MLSDDVKVSAELISLLDVNPSESHVTLDLILRKEWLDQRLAGLVEGSKRQIFSSKLPEIWTPMLEYSQSTSVIPAATSSSTLQLAADGTVTQTER